MEKRASSVKLNWLVCLMMVMSSMVVLQVSGRTAFLLLQILFCGVMLLNRKSVSFFTYPIVNLIFIELVICAFSACIGDMRYSYKKAAVVMTIYALILYFVATYLHSMIKRDTKTLPAFIKGIRIMCLIQLCWIPLQFVLYKGIGLDINKTIFVEKLHLLENASFIRSWVYYPSGLTWHSAVLAPTMVLAFLLFKNPYIRALVLVDALICGNSTTLIGVVLCAGLCFLFWLPSSTRGLMLKRATLAAFALIVVVGGFLLIRLNLLSTLLNSISYLYQRLFGNTGDASTEAHLGYYLDYFKIIKNCTPMQFLFGFGEGCSGYPITIMYDRYPELGNWSVESDIVNLALSRGIVGFVLYYYFLFYIAFKGFRRDPRYTAFMLPVLVQGFGYNVQWDYVFLIELVMYITLKTNMNFFEPYQHPLLQTAAPDQKEQPRPVEAPVAFPRDPEVSVLLLTNNADWSKLEMTLRSVLCQKHIYFQLIIADDGSKVRWDDRIEQVCREYSFTQYTFANSPENGGTCRNVFQGLSLAKGRFTKAISPGDLLYGPTTLYCWASFMREHSCSISFADAVYYHKDQGAVQILQVPNAPRQPGLYRRCCRHGVFVDYLLANDSLSGATLMMDTALMRRYLEPMLGKVIYAEDYMIRIAVFENQKILRYPNKAVWYEYGTGVSTAKSEKWAALLKKDFDACNEIIAGWEAPQDRLARRYVKYLGYTGSEKKRKLYKCLLFPELLFWRLANRFFGAKTAGEGNTEFLEMLTSADTQ